MKYRLIELLRCPDHPDAMLRVTSAHVSEIFPCAGNVRTPFCRSGCGLMSNWFADIPQNLPQAHRLDCRRCLGMEIETAALTCPECGSELKVKDGVLTGHTGAESCESDPAPGYPVAIGKLVDKLLNLQPGDITVVLAPLPEETEKTWGESGIERLHIETHTETLLANRARSCANGEGMVHYLGGPLDIDVLRPGQFDAILAAIPTVCFANLPESLDSVPALLRPSGRMLLFFQKEKNRSRAGPEKYLARLPEVFRKFERRLESTREIDLLLLTPPIPAPVEPETG